ncbi:hypothetical protein IL306_001912 [Fusarium sp. DS 682]|nr:hypothetical protein IL306_001912 [Fusarium sp. DS 682]
MASNDEVESLTPSEHESDFDSHGNDLLDNDSDFNSNPDLDAVYENYAAGSLDFPTMPYPTCGLCRFPFEAHEEFIVYQPYSVYYPRIWHGTYDPEFHIDVQIEKGFHPVCVALVQPHKLTQAWQLWLSESTEGPFGPFGCVEPPTSWTKRRVRWLQQLIAMDIRWAIDGRLPEEICHYIASFCMRERACQNLRDLWLDPGRPRFECNTDILYIGRNKSIWAQHVEVEGLRYVKSLSTHRLNLMSDQRLDPDIYDATILKPLREGQYPPPSFDARRVRWLKKTFSENLFQTLGYRLPREVCDNVARYCLKERAVQVVRDHWLKKDRPKPGPISVPIYGKPLWAQYVELEGIRYVSSLSYQSRGGDESQILSGSEDSPNIFIAHNYLGVTDIIATFGDDSPAIKQRDHSWWTVFSQYEMPFWLKAKFDGIKLRDLSLYEDEDDRPGWPEDSRWAVPPTALNPIPEPPIPCSNTWFDGDIIRAIDWNQPQTDSVIKIIQHKIDEKSPYDFGTAQQYRHSWMYFPIDSDERMSEIWIRRYGVKLPKDDRPGPAATLILRTSKGRLLTLGPQLKYRQPDGYETHAKHDLAGTMPQTYPCRMYLANWGISGSWMRLLLTYADGRQRCVGQVRPDFLLDAIDVTSENMWIGYPETEELSWRPSGKEDASGVDFISFEEPGGDEWDVPYIKIPMRGRLDWYFSEKQCHMSHEDECDPQDEFLKCQPSRFSKRGLATLLPYQTSQFNLLLQRLHQITTFMMELEFEDPVGGPDLFNVELYGDSDLYGLCRFAFTEGDKIISCDNSEPMTSIYHRKDNHLASYHRECVEFATPCLNFDGELCRSVAIATNSGIPSEVPEALRHRRRRWLEDTYAENLFQILRGRLHLEVCRNIAVYLVRERAVQVFQQMWSKSDRLRQGHISVPVKKDTTVWAQYVHYEGIRYVQSFSYDSLGGDEEIVLRRNTKKPLNFFICHNGLGVHRFVVTEGEEKPKTEQDEGHWWTMYVQQNRPFYLKGRFDGIKVRELVLVKSSKEVLRFDICAGPCEIRWDKPPTPVKLSPKIPLPDGLGDTLIRVFEWNKPGTVGYSFAISGEVILQYSSHGAGHPTPFDDDYAFNPNGIKWLHFPMNPHERVSELWIRQYPERKSTLIVVTNQGRSLVLGSQQDGPGAMYHAIAKLPQDQPCAMFYTHAFALSWCHFDSVLTWEHPQKRQIHPPWKSEPDTHYTSAKLDGLREITPCINKGPFVWGKGEMITGLLLTYTDGSRNCVGDVRHDELGTPQTVTSETMWIRYVDYKPADATDADNGTYCFDVGIEWFGFSRPLPASSFHQDEDSPIDEPDSHEDTSLQGDDSSAEGMSDKEESSDEEEIDDERIRVPEYAAVPLKGRIDWEMSSDENSIRILSHRKRSRPNDEMHYVLAEDAYSNRPGLVFKSISSLTGDIRKLKRHLPINDMSS